MVKKRYTVKTACPQCGCSRAQVMTEKEMREKYGSVPNFDVDCAECMLKYTSEMKNACPEWDKECKIKT